MTRILVNGHQWAAIKPHCMGRKGPNQTEEDVRRFIDAVVWIGRNGAPWRELPPRFGKWNTVFKRFRRGVKDSHDAASSLSWHPFRLSRPHAARLSAFQGERRYPKAFHPCSERRRLKFHGGSFCCLLGFC